MRGQHIFEQDKGVRWIRRKPASHHADSYATRIRGTPPFRYRRWPLLVLLVCTSLAWAMWFWGLHVNLSASAPRGLYRRVDAPPTRGRFVATCLPLELAHVGRERGYLGVGDCPGGVQAILKRIAAIGGDIVDSSPRRVRVNDRPVPNSETALLDSRGRGLSHTGWGRHVVRPEEVWLLSTHDPRSWDSRYFGPLNVAQIRATVQPVLTVD